MFIRLIIIIIIMTMHILEAVVLGSSRWAHQAIHYCEYFTRRQAYSIIPVTGLPLYIIILLLFWLLLWILSLLLMSIAWNHIIRPIKVNNCFWLVFTHKDSFWLIFTHWDKIVRFLPITMFFARICFNQSSVYVNMQKVSTWPEVNINI